MNARAEGIRQVLHLGFAVIELFGDMVEFEHIAVPEYGMVRRERIRWHAFEIAVVVFEEELEGW